MSEATNILIIVLAVVLVVFLIISIILAVYLIKIARQIRQTSQNISRISESTKGLVSGIVSFASPAFIKAFAGGMAKKIRAYFKEDKSTKNKSSKTEPEMMQEKIKVKKGDK